MNTKAEYREQDRMEMAIPNFAFSYCDNCNKPIEDETATFNYHRSRNGILIKIPVECCLKCVPEVIQYRHKMRDCAEMTKELVHQFNQSNYFTELSSVSYKGRLYFATKGE